MLDKLLRYDHQVTLQGEGDDEGDDEGEDEGEDEGDDEGEEAEDRESMLQGESMLAQMERMMAAQDLAMQDPAHPHHAEFMRVQAYKRG